MACSCVKLLLVLTLVVLTSEVSSRPVQLIDKNGAFTRINASSETPPAVYVKLDLFHRDSPSSPLRPPNVTHDQLLLRRLQGDRLRLRRLFLRTPDAQLHLNPGPSGDRGAMLTDPLGHGVHYVTIALGTPPQYVHVTVDIAGDLTWVQCLPCQKCLDLQDSPFDSTASSTFAQVPCLSDTCLKLPTSDQHCWQRTCQYTAKYLDGTVSNGTLATETLQFGNGDYLVSHAPFGCSHVLSSTTQSNKISGIFSFGHGPLSFATMYLSRFAYCITDATSKSPGYLTLEAGPTAEGGATSSFYFYTNALYPFLYFVPLEGISVEDERLNIPRTAFAFDRFGNGGVILDSASTLTYLVESAYDQLRDAIVDYMSSIYKPHFQSAPNVAVCFDVHGNPLEHVRVPTVHLHFTGGAIISLYKHNILIPLNGLQCLAFLPVPDGELNILGARQQQGFGVTFDLNRKRIGFASQRC